MAFWDKIFKLQYLVISARLLSIYIGVDDDSYVQNVILIEYYVEQSTNVGIGSLGVGK